MLEKITLNKRFWISTIVVMILVLLSSLISAYNVEPNSEVHQKITKEALEIWMFTPKEISSSTDLMRGVIYE